MCAPTPNGKPQEVRKMAPLLYKGKVIGNTAYERELQSVIVAASEMVRISRLKIQKD